MGFRRTVAAGVLGGIMWILGLIVIFGPAQAILSNPDYQSGKLSALEYDARAGGLGAVGDGVLGKRAGCTLTRSFAARAPGSHHPVPNDLVRSRGLNLAGAQSSDQAPADVIDAQPPWLTKSNR